MGGDLNWPGLVLMYGLIAYSIILHEIAHGYAALKFGDDTAERMDRLTLNPLQHIDPIGTVLFPLAQLLVPPHQVWLGWAKPVPVNTLRLEPRVGGEVVVSIAGVFVNFSIAVAMAVLLGIERLTPRHSMLFEVLLNTMIANIGLGIFNLLPIPPLDGSHVMKYLLPEDLRADYERLGFSGIWILLILSYTGLLGPIIGPPIHFLSNLLYTEISRRLRGFG